MSGKRKTSIQNRIVGHGEKPAADFKFNPLNWRRHPPEQEAALRGILSQVGWVTGVIENVTTGNLIDGHARVDAALRFEPQALIPYTQVRLTEDEEKKILLLFDPIGDLATADQTMIQELLDLVGDLDIDLMKVLGDHIEAVPEFEPGSIDDQGKMDALNMIVCPNCNHEFAR